MQDGVSGRDPSLRLSGRGNVRDTLLRPQTRPGGDLREAALLFGAIGLTSKKCAQECKAQFEKVVRFVSQIAGNGNVAGWIEGKRNVFDEADERRRVELEREGRENWWGRGGLSCNG